MTRRPFRRDLTFELIDSAFFGDEDYEMRRTTNSRRGFSLMELLAVVTILGIIAAIVVPRVSVSASTAKQKVHEHNIATINSAVERYYIETGGWPADNLSDIGTNVDYFPDGIPTNPVDNTAYGLDSTTHRVD